MIHSTLKNKKNNNVFRTLGASNHSSSKREEFDYYATDPIAIELLLQYETFNNNIWECACGEGHISKVLKNFGYNVYSTDLINRGYQDDQIDFLNTYMMFNGDIITNPPFKHAQKFVEKALSLVNYGSKVAMFLRLTFLEGKKRKKLFIEQPFKKIYIFSSRIQCGKNGIFKGSSVVAYAWFIWEKGYSGKPTIEWIH